MFATTTLLMVETVQEKLEALVSIIPVRLSVSISSVRLSKNVVRPNACQP
jgi:hypothetical protein